MAMLGLLATPAVTAAGSSVADDTATVALPILGPEVRISGRLAVGMDTLPAVAYNETDDEFLVVWADRRNDAASGADIYGQRFDGDGNRVGWNLRISRSETSESSPAVAYNQRRNEFFVVWEDDRDDYDRGIDVYGQRLDTGGRRLGSEFRISGGDAIGWQLRPDVGYDSINDRYLVVWQDGRNLHTSADDIYGQLLTPELDRIGWNFRISGSNATESEWAPAVAHNPVEDQWLVVWSDYRNFDTRASDIYGQRFTGDGGRLGYNFRISDTAGVAAEGFPDAAFNPFDNEYLVVWHDDRNETTRDTDVYGQRLDDLGRGLGSNLRISGPKAIDYDARAAVTYDRSADEYFVVWIDRRKDATRGLDIWGQRLSADAERLGWNLRISGWKATADEFAPAVAHGTAHHAYLVVWEDTRSEPTRSSDIYGRFMSN
jgi:hypothetical protein